jgi:hypothetical protein
MFQVDVLGQSSDITTEYICHRPYSGLLIHYTQCSCMNKFMIAVWLAAIEQSFGCNDMICGLSFHNM